MFFFEKVFERNVFINCPFDNEYEKLLKPLLFNLISNGLNPRIASERLDSGEVRLEKIEELILECKYGIHDLSRCVIREKDQYARFNLPFELAIDWTIKKHHPEGHYTDKMLLILEEERYSVNKALSDLSFADSKCHEGDPEEIVYSVRNWLYEAGINGIESPSYTWDQYNYFYSDLYEKKKAEDFSKKAIERLPVREFMQEIWNWD